MPSKSFEEVEVWKKAHAWVLAVYRFVRQMPKYELFCLSSQLRRAAVSVPANLVEGYKRRSKPEKVRFYNISQASLEEARYFLMLSRDLGYGATDQLLSMVDEISRMLEAYIRPLLDS